MKKGMKILAIVVLIAAAGATSQALAAAAFKMNRVVEPLVDAQRENWVALPYVHPFNDMQKICEALNLTPGNANAKVRRVDPAPGGQSPSWNCGDLGKAPCLQNDTGACSFPLVGGTPEHVKRAGLIVTNNVATSGIIVGTHVGNPPGTITLKPLGAGSPIGDNYFSVPYHTTSLTMQDVCTDLGLPGTSAVKNALVSRRNSSILFPQPTTSWDCGALGTAPSLFLGQALRITYKVDLIVTGDINVAAGKPAHF